MKLSVRLRNVRRIFLDTGPVIYFVEKNPVYVAKVKPVFTRIDAGGLTAVTSPITLSECLVHPFLTNDPILKRVAGIDVIVLDEVEAA